MAKILVHLATGPENPTRAALAFLVARTAVAEGHEVRMFLAGDAVQLARRATAEVTQGIGTGSLAEHWRLLADAGVEILLSGMSSKARGVDSEDALGPVELAPPERLVESSLWADRTFVY